jgi:hypothetical protein
LTDTVQPPTGIEPPVKVTLEVVVLGVPPQVVVALPDVTTPLGKLSVNGAVRLAIVLLRLVKVMVRVDPPGALMVAGLKDLPSVGGITVTGKVTVKVATSGAMLLPLLVCNAPADSELI